MAGEMMRNKGYTLVEIAIVIVIIGLLIGGVIKGESLIQSAKISNAITLAQDISVAIGTFKQRYHMLPGDMLIDAATPEINVRVECWTGGKKGNNNGQIDASESECVAEELFQAGMAKVDQDNGLPVFKSAYGLVSVKAASLSEVTLARGNVNPFVASVTHVVEFANLPCAVVQEIDRKIDNDDIKTGKGIASVDTCPADNIIPFYAIAL
jgi:prepilin-type N-terminal cleavage/methylation domain-containing protein